ncbi:alpha/beta hydrolase [Mobilitalea sibirica]|uniref:Alpha/beta hydrolase n=1 Tax=Mobilitalea sibirica TaxID=1462919 RepID=A0A8J7L356_9FIRM|nr:alpha/beta hydrolase [Mobilitalea sibirica]MBH1941858.1 alpha/beta hydrolase [Mobilitalea sibirica]
MLSKNNNNTYSKISTGEREVIKLQADFSQRSCRMTLSVEYTRIDGMPLHLHIIEPEQKKGEMNNYPLILFIQGSGWMKQDLGVQLAQLSKFSSRGYVIAVVEYRPSSVAPFPAQIEDAKTAIRYMVKHASTYHADPNHIILWGDSSGGHTAIMAGFTYAKHEFEEDNLVDEKSIKAIIDYYAPTDISEISLMADPELYLAPDSLIGMWLGGVSIIDHPDKVIPTIPMNYLSPDKQVPPVFIIHGSVDTMVPFYQSELLFRALNDLGKDTVCYKLEGADHGGSAFWTEEIFDLIEEFLSKYI